jgi:hypothetical protein
MATMADGGPHLVDVCAQLDRIEAKFDGKFDLLFDLVRSLAPHLTNSNNTNIDNSGNHNNIENNSEKSNIIPVSSHENSVPDKEQNSKAENNEGNIDGELENYTPLSKRRKRNRFEMRASFIFYFYSSVFSCFKG